MLKDDYLNWGFKIRGISSETTLHPKYYVLRVCREIFIHIFEQTWLSQLDIVHFDCLLIRFVGGRYKYSVSNRIILICLIETSIAYLTSLSEEILTFIQWTHCFSSFSELNIFFIASSNLLFYLHMNYFITFFPFIDLVAW